MQTEQNEGRSNALIALTVFVFALALTWAVATLFEIGIAKALAAVIIGMFCLLIVLLMAGVG